MRKVDPADVLKDFNVACQELLDHFDRIDKAITTHSTREGDLSRLATQSFLSLFVAFERFCSDLLLAYLNRDFSLYQTDLAGRIGASIKDKYGAGVAARITFEAKKHVSVAELEEIVDPTGWNLTFSNVAKLKDYANKVLVPVYAKRIASITAPEARLVDTARTIRDFIAHQSVGAKKRMNEALSTIEAGVHNRHLGRAANEIHVVGSYLKANPAGTRRFHMYAHGLLAVAARM